MQSVLSALGWSRTSKEQTKTPDRPLFYDDPAQLDLADRAVKVLREVVPDLPWYRGSYINRPKSGVRVFMPRRGGRFRVLEGTPEHEEYLKLPSVTPEEFQETVQREFVQRLGPEAGTFLFSSLDFSYKYIDGYSKWYDFQVTEEKVLALEEAFATPTLRSAAKLGYYPDVLARLEQRVQRVETLLQAYFP